MINRREPMVFRREPAINWREPTGPVPFAVGVNVMTIHRYVDGSMIGVFEMSEPKLSEAKFKTGDVVTLKSGGPAMTVSRVYPNLYAGSPTQPQPNVYETCWFEDGVLRRDTFSEPCVAAGVGDGRNP